MNLIPNSCYTFCLSRNTFPISLSQACLKLVDQASIHWVPDFIWHCQNSDLLKNRTVLRWSFQRRTFSRFAGQIVIHCYGPDWGKTQAHPQPLLRATIDHLPFAFEDLVIWYQDGRCMLEEELGGRYATAN